MEKTAEIPGKKPRNVSLDLVKLLAAYMVVLIHFPFPGTLGEVLVGIARFAVPVFFMVSGYYAYRSEPEAIKAKAWKNLKVYLTAAFVYLVYKLLVEGVVKGTLTDGVAYLKGYLDFEVIGKFLLFNATRSSGHLWFMTALIYCYGILYVVRKRKIKETVIFAVAGLLLLVRLFLAEGLSLLERSIPDVLVRNFLLMGIPFFAIGMGIFKYEEKLTKCSGRILVLLFFLGLAEAAASTLLLGKNEIHLGTMVAAAAAMLLALKAREVSWGTGLTLLSGISTEIYLWHSLIGESFVLPGLKEWLEKIPGWNFLNPVVTCILITFLAMLLKKRRVSKRYKGEIPCEKQ